ncbi:hypothetical protein THIOKS1560004 [Thiocapsa sp. KS1]|nr:hypothetical protein THIOKS1560004 [Thiocapsa sp. KS1]
MSNRARYPRPAPHVGAFVRQRRPKQQASVRFPGVYWSGSEIPRPSEIKFVVVVVIGSMVDYDNDSDNEQSRHLCGAALSR